jgi:hypothetical protein
LSQSRKLILVTDQKNLWAGHDTRKEVLASCEFTTKFPGSIDRRIHLSSEVPLRFREGRKNLVHRNPLSDDHDVHIAACGFVAGYHRAIEEGELDPASQSRQAVPQNLSDTKALPDESSQFLEHRTLAARLKVGLPAFHCAGENPGGGELFQLSLHRPRPKAAQTDDLPLVETLVGVAEQQAQHSLPGGAEECRSDGIRTSSVRLCLRVHALGCMAPLHGLQLG